jgi:hypothetical protein
MLFPYYRITLIIFFFSVVLFFSSNYLAAAIWVLLVFQSGIPVSLVAPAAQGVNCAVGLTSLPGYLAALVSLFNVMFLFITAVQPVSPLNLAVFLAIPLDLYYAVVL